MPGKPLPRPDSNAQFVRDPRTGRTVAGPTPGSQRREQERATEQTDRRLGARREQAPPVHVGPFPPRWTVGALWWDTESTAENP